MNMKTVFQMIGFAAILLAMAIAYPWWAVLKGVVLLLAIGGGFLYFAVSLILHLLKRVLRAASLSSPDEPVTKS
jgi:hypothetical protein